MYVKDGNTNLFPLSMLKIESMWKGKNFFVCISQTNGFPCSHTQQFRIPVNAANCAAEHCFKKQSQKNFFTLDTCDLRMQKEKKCTSSLDLCHINHTESILCANIFMSSFPTFSYFKRMRNQVHSTHINTAIFQSVSSAIQIPRFEIFS